MFTDFIKQFDVIADKVKNAEILLDPWPHLFVQDVFDDEFYSKMLAFANWPEVTIDTKAVRETIIHFPSNRT